MVKIQNGRLGLDSPSQASDYVITIEQGVYSRTGRSTGNADEARGVRVIAWAPCDPALLPNALRTPLHNECVFGADRYDATARNAIGGTGAYVTDPPDDAVVAAAVERARAAVLRTA